MIRHSCFPTKQAVPFTVVTFLLSLMFSGFLAAQTAVVGNETLTNSNSGYAAPYANYSNGAKHQFVYLRSELISAGFSAGQIDRFGFHVAALNSVAPLQQFYISMKNSATSSLSAWEEGMVPVYGPVTYTPKTGWNMHVLDVPFIWDGTSNIVVEVCSYNPTTSFNASTYLSDAFSGASRYYRGYSSTVCAATSVTGTTRGRPNASFHRREAFGVALQNNSGDQWVHSGTTGTYKVFIENTGTSGDTIAVQFSSNRGWTYTMYQENTGNAMTSVYLPAMQGIMVDVKVDVPAGLPLGQTDEMMMKGVSRGNPVKADSIQIITTVLAPNNVFPYAEDFESGFPPVGWKIVNTNQNSGWFRTIGYNSSYGAASQIWFNSVPAYYGDEWLISPGLQLAGGKEYALTFYAKVNSIDEHFKNTMKVYVLTSLSDTAAVLRANGTLLREVSLTTSYYKYTLDLKQFSGQLIYLGFNQIIQGLQSNTNYVVYLDDVVVTEKPARAVKIVKQTGQFLGETGKYMVHPLEIVNLGSMNDTYTLSYSGASANWTFEFLEHNTTNSITQVAVGAFDTVIVDFRVGVPAAAQNQAVGNADVKATSQGNSEVFDQVSTETYAVVPLTAPSLQSFDQNVQVPDLPWGWQGFSNHYDADAKVTTTNDLMLSPYSAPNQIKMNNSYSVSPQAQIYLATPGLVNLQQNRIKFWASGAVTGQNPMPYLIVGVLSNPRDLSTFLVIDTIKTLSAVKRSYVYTFASVPAAYRYVAFRHGASGAGTNAQVLIDHFSFEPLPVTCAEPTDLRIEQLSQTTATLQWNESAGALTWEMKWGEAGYHPDSGGTLITGIQSRPYTLNNLQSARVYDVYVRSVCAAEAVSAWSEKLTFQTAQVAATIPYLESFEDTVLQWSFGNGESVNRWVTGTAVAHTGNRSAYISNDGGVTNAYTTSSPSIVHLYRDIELPAIPGVAELTFKWKVNGQYNADKLSVHLVPVTETPLAGLPVIGGSISATNFWNQSTWKTEKIVLGDTLQGKTRRLLFTWINNSSAGSQPPIAIDSVAIIVKPYGALAGTVSDSTGKRISGATVYAGGRVVNTNQNGEYILTGLLAGSYRFTAATGGYRSDTATVQIIALDTVTHHFVFNYSNPNFPFSIRYLANDMSNRIGNGAATDGRYVYTPNTADSRVYVTDMIDPENPLEKGSIMVPGASESFAHNGHLFVSDLNNRLHILDKPSAPDSFIIKIIMNLNGRVRDMEFSGNAAFVLLGNVSGLPADRTRLSVYDIANAANPTLKSQIEFDGNPISMSYIEERDLLLIDGRKGDGTATYRTIVNTANKDSIKIISVKSISPRESGLIGWKNHYFSSVTIEGKGYIRAYSTADPASPALLGSMLMPDDKEVYSMADIEGLLYVHLSNQQVVTVVFDTTNNTFHRGIDFAITRGYDSEEYILLKKNSSKNTDTTGSGVSKYYLIPAATSPPQYILEILKLSAPPPIQSYSLTMQITPAAAATDGCIVTPAPGVYTFSSPTTVNINEIAVTGWYFVEWQGAAAKGPATVVVDGHKVVTGVFGPEMIVAGHKMSELVCPADPRSTFEYPMGTVTFSAGGDDWTLGSFKLDAAGTGHELNDIDYVKFEQGSWVFFGHFLNDDGTINVSIQPPLVIPKGQTRTIRVYYKFEYDTLTYSSDTVRTFRWQVSSGSVGAQPVNYVPGLIAGRGRTDDLVIARVHNVTRQTAFTTIAEAINPANLGERDDVYVCPCEYPNTNLYLQKKVNLRSYKGRERTILKRGSSSEGILYIASGISCLVEGFTFDGIDRFQKSHGIVNDELFSNEIVPIDIINNHFVNTFQSILLSNLQSTWHPVTIKGNSFENNYCSVESRDRNLRFIENTGSALFVSAEMGDTIIIKDNQSVQGFNIILSPRLTRNTYAKIEENRVLTATSGMSISIDFEKDQDLFFLDLSIIKNRITSLRIERANSSISIKENTFVDGGNAMSIIDPRGNITINNNTIFSPFLIKTLHRSNEIMKINIENNRFVSLGNTQGGLDINGFKSEKNEILIQRNTFTENKKMGLPSWERGALTISDLGNVQVHKNNFSENYNGAAISNCGKVYVTENRAWSNKNAFEIHGAKVLHVKDNIVYNNTKGVGVSYYPEFPSESGMIAGNYMFGNCTGLELLHADNIKVKNNTICNSWCLNTGIKLEESNAIIEGNDIFGNNGNGIYLGQGAEATVRFNNLSNNAPYSLNNSNSGFTLLAGDNYWGNATGPQAGSYSGNITIPGWLSQPVSMRVTFAESQKNTQHNVVDSVLVQIRNIQAISDSVTVSIRDSHGWLTGDTLFSSKIPDSTAISFYVTYLAPPARSSNNTITVHATSLINSGVAATDSMKLLAYTSVPTTLQIIVDSVAINRNDSLRLQVLCLDQNNQEMDAPITWLPSSGRVDSLGWYYPDSVSSIVQITASITGSSLVGTSHLHVWNNNPQVKRITISPKIASISNGGTQLFSAELTDSLGYSVLKSPVWSASGGYISEIGYYSASDTAGLYTVIAKDTLTGIYDSAFVTVGTYLGIPNTPLLSSPASGSIGVSLSPSFVWFSTANADLYRIQIATDTLFTNLIFNAATADTFYQHYGLQQLSTYYWRVRSLNMSGESDWAAFRAFRTLGTPSSVQLVHPAQNASGVPIDVSFKWTRATDLSFRIKDGNVVPELIDSESDTKETHDAGDLRQRSNSVGAIKKSLDTEGREGATITNYWFELVTDTLTFAGIQRDSTLTDTIKIVQGLAHQNNYYWRIRAKNETGWGAYTGWSKFTTIMAPPMSPVLVSPQNNSTGHLTPVNLVWGSAQNSERYILQLAPDSLFTVSVHTDTLGVDTMYTTAALQLLTTYYWRVKAGNAGGESGWSQVWSFRTMGTPTTVSPIQPQPYAINQPVTLQFIWSKAIDQKKNPVIKSSNPEHRFSNTKPMIDAEEINEQHARIIETGKLTEEVALNSKIAVTNKSRPAITEADNEAVSRYWFELVSDTVSFAGLNRDSTLTDTLKTVENLIYLTKYYWRVRALNENGWGSFNSWSPFSTIIQAPQTPELVSPADSTTSVSLAPFLQWRVSARAANYQVLLSRDTAFTQLILDSLNADTTVAVPSLSYYTSYYWKVRASNTGGNSAWTPVFNFRTMAQPITWCNLQGPELDTVMQFHPIQVVARVRIDSVTHLAGAQDSLLCWIGYSTENNNPAGWQNWVPAQFSAEINDADEYSATLGATLPPGTYYYASRFRYLDGAYRYGGFSSSGGGFWDSTVNHSGMLHIKSPLIPLWERSSAGGNLPAWFGQNTERGMACNPTPYPGVPVKQQYHLYVVSRSSGTAVRILDAATGTDVGMLSTSGITGGTIVLNDIAITNDRVILASNVTLDASTSPLKIYLWSSEAATPQLVISYTATENIRLGDQITVFGNYHDGTAKLYTVSQTGKVYIWVMSGGQFTQVPQIVSLSDSPTGSLPSVSPLSDGVLYWKANGQNGRKYSADGTLLGIIPTDALPGTANSLRSVDRIGNDHYFVSFQYGAGNNNLRIITVQGGKPDSTVPYALTAPLGLMQNTNGTGAVAVKSNSNGSKDIYLLATNNGIAAYRTVEVIPVELAYFTAESIERNVSLEWATVTEKNSHSFEVERMDESGSWRTLSSIRAAGNTLEEQVYRFVDRKLDAGQYSYRLRMIDLDGTSVCSEIATVEIALPKVYKLEQNYPNPFNPSTRIEYQLPLDGRVQLELYAITGERVATLVDQEMKAGYYTYELQRTAHLASGVYIYRIIASATGKPNPFISIKKMVLMK